VDARVSPLNPQDPLNHLGDIPNGFESNVFLPLCPLIWCASCGAAFRPVWASSVMGSAMHVSTPLRQRTRLCCFRKCPAVGWWVPPRGSPRGLRGSTRGFLRGHPRGFLRAPRGSPKGFPRVFPRGASEGSSRASLGILNLRWGLLPETAVLYMLLRCMLLSRARM
jgi:hypothetical protein